MASPAPGVLDQLIVTFATVRFEIGKPDLRLFSLKVKIERGAVEFSRDPEPVFVVIRRHCLIAIPRFVVGRLAGIAQLKMVSVPWGQAIDLEMEPLKMRAFAVRLDGQLHLQRIAGVQHLNIAAVEVAADMK